MTHGPEGEEEERRGGEGEGGGGEEWGGGNVRFQTGSEVPINMSKRTWPPGSHNIPQSLSVTGSSWLAYSPLP